MVWVTVDAATWDDGGHDEPSGLISPLRPTTVNLEFVEFFAADVMTELGSGSDDEPTVWETPGVVMHLRSGTMLFSPGQEIEWLTRDLGTGTGVRAQ